MDSPFDVLGVDPDADDEEIVRAYRRRVLETHPDQGGSARDLQRVRDAYETIRERRVGAARDGPDADAAPDARTADADAAPDADDAEEAWPEEGAEPEGVRVEYLDYGVCADRGWSLDDPRLFERAAAADLDHESYGQFLVEPRETLLEAAENRGYAWPYACRGGACANCAVALVEGEMPMSAAHILTDDLIDRGFRLSCLTAPTTDARIVFNVKHLPGLDELRLPPYRFERVHSDD